MSISTAHLKCFLTIDGGEQIQLTGRGIDSDEFGRPCNVCIGIDSISLAKQLEAECFSPGAKLTCLVNVPKPIQLFGFRDSFSGRVALLEVRCDSCFWETPFFTATFRFLYDDVERMPTIL